MASLSGLGRWLYFLRRLVQVAPPAFSEDRLAKRFPGNKSHPILLRLKLFFVLLNKYKRPADLMGRLI